MTNKNFYYKKYQLYSLKIESVTISYESSSCLHKITYLKKYSLKVLLIYACLSKK